MAASHTQHGVDMGEGQASVTFKRSLVEPNWRMLNRIIVSSENGDALAVTATDARGMVFLDIQGEASIDARGSGWDRIMGYNGDEPFTADFNGLNGSYPQEFGPFELPWVFSVTNVPEGDVVAVTVVMDDPPTRDL